MSRLPRVVKKMEEMEKKRNKKREKDLEEYVKLEEENEEI